jgi:Tol biopolymer transport system component
MHTVAQLGATAPEMARLSPNGRWIAYHQLGEDGTRNVMLTATTRSTTTRLAAHPANDLLPVWTADGEHIVFVSDRTGSLAAWIVEVSPQGQAVGEPRVLKSDFGRSVPMGFTNDGALIYAQQVGVSDIYTAPLSAEDGTLGARTSVGGRLVGVNRLPRMSPDGRRMVYVSEPGLLADDLGPKVVTIRDMESNREHVLAPMLRRMMAPRWQFDGRLVAEAVDEDGSWGVYAIDADTSATELLAGWDNATCGCSASPVVSADGSRLAYYRPRGDGETGDLMVLHLRTGAELTLVESIAARDIADMDFSPDGESLATAIRPQNRGRADGWRLQFLDVATGRRTNVTSLGTEYEALTLSGWTDGGQGLLFVRAEADRHSLGWVSTDGQDLVWLILDLPRDIREVVLHPRYDRLVFSAGEYRAEVWMLENPLAEVDLR